MTLTIMTAAAEVELVKDVTIENLAKAMLKEVYPVSPALFAKAGAACCSGACPEGKMSCGKALEVRQEFEAMKSAVKI